MELQTFCGALLAALPNLDRLVAFAMNVVLLT